MPKEEVVSAAAEINESWGWVVKAGEANRELWSLVKKGSFSEAMLLLNAHLP
ncbi:MAG: hypothetical protein QXT19_05125 [Candidatus Woesearchaeota archaeon]